MKGTQRKQKPAGTFWHRWACRAPVVLVLLMVSMMLWGCGHGLSGKYQGTGGIGSEMSVEFKSSSKAYVTVMGTTVESKYDVDDHVTLHDINGSNVVMTIEKDGSLTGPMGLTLKKE